jgi:hypothetical protein
MNAKPLKESELRHVCVCVACQRKLGKTGSPTFLRVHIEQHILNLPAIERQNGLGVFMGNGFLAQTMGPDEDMTVTFEPPRSMTICAECAERHGWTALLDGVLHHDFLISA